jgi:hypothetical protein
MSSDNQISINPYNYVKTTESIINNIIIHINRIELFKNIQLTAILLNDTRYVDSKQIELSGEEYTNWGNDDNYIINTVLAKLNLSLPAGSVNIA